MYICITPGVSKQLPVLIHCNVMKWAPKAQRCEEWRTDLDEHICSRVNQSIATDLYTVDESLHAETFCNQLID